jgi:hypothetical protein
MLALWNNGELLAFLYTVYLQILWNGDFVVIMKRLKSYLCCKCWTMWWMLLSLCCGFNHNFEEWVMTIHIDIDDMQITALFLVL